MTWQEKAMAPHSSILARKIPWAEEPGGLESMKSQRAGMTEVTERGPLDTRAGMLQKLSVLKN